MHGAKLIMTLVNKYKYRTYGTAGTVTGRQNISTHSLLIPRYCGILSLLIPVAALSRLDHGSRAANTSRYLRLCAVT